MKEGTYNLVAEKAGFGWKYIYHVRIKNGVSLQIEDMMTNNGLGMVQTCSKFSNVVHPVRLMTKDMKTRIKIHSDIYEIMIGNGHLSNGVSNVRIDFGA